MVIMTMMTMMMIMLVTMMTMMAENAKDKFPQPSPGAGNQTWVWHQRLEPICLPPHCLLGQFDDGDSALRHYIYEIWL